MIKSQNFDMNGMSGWSKQIFNDNMVPLTHEQELLRAKVEKWLEGVYRLGVREVNFVTVGDQFQGENYSDLQRVYDQLHMEDILEQKGSCQGPFEDDSD